MNASLDDATHFKDTENDLGLLNAEMTPKGVK